MKCEFKQNKETHRNSHTPYMLLLTYITLTLGLGS